MTKRQQNSYQDRMELTRNGWQLHSKTDHIAFNGGSETVDHLVGKAVAAKALREIGYRVASEVAKDNVGEIDLVGYGHDSREMIGIEIETDLRREIILDKYERYCVNEPVTEIFAFDPEDLPDDLEDAVDHVKEDIAYE
ncbi:hypothetical protein [Natrinema sp. H-ect4]|uniref:hypothetical protein n=1 Tax=Natrinema sp. H-ect4 TaxID=3242699 RepID=UPI0035A87C2F